MMNDESNLILPLLRGLRAEQDSEGQRLIRVERRVDEVHESATSALGMAAHSNVVLRRVTDLESKA